MSLPKAQYLACVVGEAADWPTALAQAPATHPDMVVMDWDLVAKGVRRGPFVTLRGDLGRLWPNWDYCCWDTLSSQTRYTYYTRRVDDGIL